MTTCGNIFKNNRFRPVERLIVDRGYKTNVEEGRHTSNLTCSICGSQNFTIRDRSPYDRELDILECNGWGCGRLFIRAELPQEPRKTLKELACPICPDVVFYGDYAKDWMKRHFEIAHPAIKLKVMRGIKR